MYLLLHINSNQCILFKFLWVKNNKFYLNHYFFLNVKLIHVLEAPLQVLQVKSQPKHYEAGRV